MIGNFILPVYVGSLAVARVMVVDAVLDLSRISVALKKFEIFAILNMCWPDRK